MMQIEDVANELRQNLVHNPTLVPAMIHKAEVVLDKHCRTLTKIKGHYPAPHTILGRLIQGFKAEWQAMGELEIKNKILKNYHQKVNFPIIPSEILGSYYADYYDEEKDMFTMPISDYIMKQELMPQITDDLEELSINGVYDAATADGQFGHSLDGIRQVCLNILADAVHPAFKIPLNLLSDTNIVDEVTSFERKLPNQTKKRVKKIFLSENNVERYILQYRAENGNNQFNKDDLKTVLGKREIVMLPGLSDDLIFATVERNLIKLIDKIDNPPKVTSVQVQDYTVKVFMEFWLGYDFWINELVYIANYADATYGLGSTVLNQKYYEFDGVTV